MSRRTEIAKRVTTAIDASGLTPDKVADAADIPSDQFAALLRGELAFTVDQLVNVGGVLRVSPSKFLEGIN